MPHKEGKAVRKRTIIELNVANLHACTVEARDFRNNYYKTYDCMYTHAVVLDIYDVHSHSDHLSITAFRECI